MDLRWLTIVLMTLMLAGATGCGLSRLQGAFETNQQNVNDISSNVQAMHEVMVLWAAHIWEQEMALRQERINRELQTIGGELRNAASLDALLSDSSTVTGHNYQLLRDAAAVAGSSEQRARLEDRNPVLYAVMGHPELREQVARDAAALRASFDAGGDDVALHQQIAHGYPYMQKAVQARIETIQKIDSHRVALVRQLHLAATHAALFTYAAETQTDVRRAFASILDEEELEQVLALIRHDPTRSATRETIDDIRTLFGGVSPPNAAQ